jgi:hypothetical protein
VNDLLTRLWRLGKPLQWRFLWLVHAKFICGITGVVRDDHGRVLLLRHRLWPPGRQWGDPKEVLEARLFNPADLPDGMPEAHRELAASF